MITFLKKRIHKKSQYPLKADVIFIFNLITKYNFLKIRFNLEDTVLSEISKLQQEKWFPRWHIGKESACQCRRHERHRFNPRVGKIPWVGNGNPLQYSCQENSMDRGAWQARVYGVSKSRTCLSSSHGEQDKYSTIPLI